MKLEKHELVEIAKRNDHRVFWPSHAAFVGGMLGFATVTLLAFVFAGSSCHDFEDVVFYILIPGVLGGMIGASSGLAAFLTVSGRGVHPILAGFAGAVLVPVLSAIVMIVWLRVSKPDLFLGETSLGDGFELSWWWAIYLFIVFPISIIVGVIGGFFINGRLSKP
ncbi:hypothetical protein NZK35_00480 [Stieleria sp. ICT_E10.1]|uniref:hypothetical protein n=1 Tax=Stieleria sedimenti TaxID=2976331 RepID=UPI00217FC835|nr:hypothetical protein [Stieleria sedimenti]MCS7465145.1 hypothetical protein [Stieleria sedimenti]